MHKNSHKTALFLIFFTGSVSVNASEPQQQSSKGVLSGSLAVLSQYIYRGGIENDQPTLQAGLEYEHASGLYAGYWASTLNYDAADISKDHGVEHDFYMGYAGTLSPDVSYRSHIVTYFSVHDKFHRTLILSGFCLLKIAKISLNSSFFPKPIKR
ncbi:TorF family putative porin [Acinetobacter johnsonii]|uniref:TorF family putative porin n=1 Tax=Acinetobacter johnsonii TaxID=40214 RepID=UPI001D0E3F1C|nr:TorF family putative porin [Acinetobacter johnsonii]